MVDASVEAIRLLRRNSGVSPVAYRRNSLKTVCASGMSKPKPVIVMSSLSPVTSNLMPPSRTSLPRVAQSVVAASDSKPSMTNGLRLSQERVHFHPSGFSMVIE